MKDKENYLNIIDDSVKRISEEFEFDSRARDRLKVWFDNAVQNERYKKVESKKYYDALTWFYGDVASKLTFDESYEIIEKTWSKEIADKIKKEMGIA